MESLPLSLANKLQQRVEADALRILTTQGVLVDFSSNDYLGYASNTDIFEKAHQYLLNNGINANGATGSRLITGNHDLYKETEDHIAAFHKAESALIFNSGYDANVGLFSSVPQKR
jgi:8-amino-7-oxononanoate synthase